MALVVGELTAMLGVDDTAVAPGLRQAEQAMRRSGERMGDDAERAGRQAGQNLGEGLTDGADRAGRQAGDALGTSLTDSGQQGADQAVGGMTDRLGQLKMAAAGVGVAAGAALMGAFSEALNQGQAIGKLQAQLGATPAEAQRYGKIAGDLYAQAITGSVEEGTQAIRHSMQAGLIPPDATNAQIESITRKVSDLSTAFEVDLGESTVAVGQMIRTGMVKDASEGLDLVAKAFQINDQRADDMLDTLKEYPTQFRDLGLSGATALGIMQQGLDGSAKDSDIVADALKELNIRVQSLDAADGLKTLKIDANEASAAFAEGGPKAAEMLDLITDRLRAVKDPTERYRLAQELLGTQSEDLSKALLDIDPSEADRKMGNFKGTLDEAGNALRDNAGSRLTAFRNSMQQNLVEFLGSTVIPGLDTFRSKVGKVFGGLWSEAGKGSEGTADRIISFFGLLAQKVGQKLVEQVPKAIEGLMNFGGKIADFVAANPEKVLKIGLIAAAITLAIVALPITVGAALSAAVAMIMIGFVRNLITGLNDNLPKWWQSFKDWISTKAGEAGTMFTAVGLAIGVWFGGLWSRYISGPVGRAWSSFIGGVGALPGRAVGALATLGGVLSAKAASSWQSFKDAASRKGTEFITWVTGLPRRAKSALGDLGSYLASSGRSLIQGFINGIKEKIGSVRSAASSVVSAARDYFPFSPARKGPFSGRGYSTYSGQALISDFAKSIKANTGQVGRALAGMPGMPDAMADASLGALAATPTPGELAAARVPAVTAGSASTPKLVRVDLGGGLGDAIVGALREKVGIGGGDVQLYLGTNR